VSGRASGRVLIQILTGMNAKKNTFIIKSRLSIVNTMLCKSPVVPSVDVPFSNAGLSGVQSCAALLSISARRVYSVVDL
jgi:hypothetical protein